MLLPTFYPRLFHSRRNSAIHSQPQKCGRDTSPHHRPHFVRGKGPNLPRKAARTKLSEARARSTADHLARGPSAAEEVGLAANFLHFKLFRPPQLQALSRPLR